MYSNLTGKVIMFLMVMKFGSYTSKSSRDKNMLSTDNLNDFRAEFPAFYDNLTVEVIMLLMVEKFDGYVYKSGGDRKPLCTDELYDHRPTEIPTFCDYKIMTAEDCMNLMILKFDNYARGEDKNTLSIDQMYDLGSTEFPSIYEKAKKEGTLKALLHSMDKQRDKKVTFEEFICFSSSVAIGIRKVLK